MSSVISNAAEIEFQIVHGLASTTEQTMARPMVAAILEFSRTSDDAHTAVKLMIEELFFIDSTLETV